MMLCAQNFDISFQRNQHIVVQNSDNSILKYPWIGGLNSPYFSEVDIDRDGHQDLFVFEKHGNRILPLLWRPEGFVYAPEYRYAFPNLHDWAFLKDYDGDGRADLFTYGLASIQVYRNVSEENLRFELVTPQLNSYYYNGFTNIFTSPDDYFALVDLDNDGDLDLLNFWLLGKYLHCQKNLSQERYHNSDSLDFVLYDECWGKFSEAADNSEITLFTSCEEERVAPPYRHIGSSIFATDFSGNGLVDLVIGDVDSPELILLLNGGTIDNPLMVTQTTHFPTEEEPVYLYSMPAVSYVDCDHDGVKEMIVSPSDPSLTKSQDLNSVWLYKYQDTIHKYKLQTQAFVQEQTIDVGSGAHPILYDWNRDGLLDLFVCNYGAYDSTQVISGIPNSYFSSSISYFQNVGTLYNPSFKLITDDFGNFRAQNWQALHITFGDLNGDGVPDMICGERNGTLSLYFTLAVDSGLPIFSIPTMPFSPLSVGDYSTPQLYDFDDDGVLELVVGNKRGTLSLYRNVGSTTEPSFILQQENFGDVDVRNADYSFFGYSVPNFVKIDEETWLFCGSEQGDIFCYRNIDNNLSGSFLRIADAVERVYERPQYIKEGIRSAVALGNLNGDGKMDMIVGNWAGGVSFFEGCQSLPITIEEMEEIQNCQIFPNPVKTDFQLGAVGWESALCYLVNLSGQVVFSFLAEEFPAHISLPKLPNGLYFLQIFPNCQNILGKSKKMVPIIKKVIIFANY